MWSGVCISKHTLISRDSLYLLTTTHLTADSLAYQSDTYREAKPLYSLYLLSGVLCSITSGRGKAAAATAQNRYSSSVHYRPFHSLKSRLGLSQANSSLSSATLPRPLLSTTATSTTTPHSPLQLTTSQPEHLRPVSACQSNFETNVPTVQHGRRQHTRRWLGSERAPYD